MECYNGTVHIRKCVLSVSCNLLQTDQLRVSNLASGKNMMAIMFQLVIWKIIDDMVEDGKLNYEYARVASTLPGSMAALDYNDIPPNIPLPNSLKSKDQYRKWVVERVLEGDIANLPELENFVFGIVSKKANVNFKISCKTRPWTYV